MLVDNTPLETYYIRETPVLVKREDLCSPFPGPAFSKIRGVVAHIRNRPESIIGVLDTYHSKAGWAVSYVCQALGKRTVNFWPRYKSDGPELRSQQVQAARLGAELAALPAGRSSILFHQAKKELRNQYGSDTYMMPNALKLPESIEENAKEAERSIPYLPSRGVLVISISSGTVAAGILRGLRPLLTSGNWWVYLHMGYSRSHSTTREYILERSLLTRLEWASLIEFVDENYNYADSAPGGPAPFPCNPYYDLKAWRWLTKSSAGVSEIASHLHWKHGNILFWNIGA